MLGEYAYIFLGLAAAWVVQSFLSVWQSNRFMGRFRELRKDGTAAIGSAGSKYKGRVYTVLVVDKENKIVHSELLSGWTIFAKLKPISELIGVTLDDLMDESKEFPVKKKVLEAFRYAGNEIIKKDNPSEDAQACGSSASQGTCWRTLTENKKTLTNPDSEG